MRVIIAPDSFKGSLGAADVARAIADGWRATRPNDEILVIPQADGGEGTLDAVAAHAGSAHRRSVGDVVGPDGRSVAGEWLELPDGVAVVELALTSGLTLMDRLDPLRATTYGLGEVLRHALESGAHSIVVALGGSATTDGGSGALAALGARFFDERDRPLVHGGGALATLHRADFSELMTAPAGGVTLLVDVQNPLLGPRGAAAVFGPQKGAGPEEVAQLEAGLAAFAEQVGGAPDAPGAGAAGGTAFGLSTVWGAKLVSGSRRIQEITGFAAEVRTADIVITGEGRFDSQSLSGKVVGEILRASRDAGATVGVISGQVALNERTWTASLADLSGSVEQAIARPEQWLRVAGALAAKDLTSPSG